jgi:hypothetical protein
LKSVFAVWEELKGQMPDSDLKRMDEQATRFLESLGELSCKQSVRLFFEAKAVFKEKQLGLTLPQ